METREKTEIGIKQIREFSDLNGRDLSKEDLSQLSPKVLSRINFDTKTQWPEKDKLPDNFSPEQFLEESKNPGLGIKNLHKAGIDGRGIRVAIIDQKLLLGHQEYKDQLKDYKEIGDSSKEEAQMHGVAVASLLLGKECGVAPQSELIYRAIPSGRSFPERALAIRDIIEFNNTVSKDKKVKVISSPIGYITKKSEPGLEEYIMAIKDAKASGIIFIDTANNFDLHWGGGGSVSDKENPEKYMLALYMENWLDIKAPKLPKEKLAELPIIIPSDYRGMASEKGESDYNYNGKGGASWSVPYLAGIVALTLQVNPNLSEKQISGLISETATTNSNGLKVINPEKAIEKASKMAQEQ